MFAKLNNQLFSYLNRTLSSIQSAPSWRRQLPLIYVSAIPGLCGIACVAMLIKTMKKADADVPLLTKKYQSKRRFYLDQIGWTHTGLVTVLSEYGIHAETFHWKTTSWILAQLKQRRYVIVSLRVPPIENLSETQLYQPIDREKPLAQHLCLLYGYSDGVLLMADPRQIGRYSLVELPLSTFVSLFTGKGVVITTT